MRHDLPLPAPPERLRRGPFREGAFSARLHDARTATVARALAGAAFVVCFLTGLLSHYLQHPPAWLHDPLPSRPVGATGSPRACTWSAASPRSRCCW